MANIFIATSTTATSTFANGLNINGGCFSVNNTCVTGNVSSVTASDSTLNISPNIGAVQAAVNTALFMLQSIGTTQGDITYYNGSSWTRLARPAGSSSYNLTIVAGAGHVPIWGVQPAPAPTPTWSATLSQDGGNTSNGNNPQLTTTDQLQFRDASNYIYSPGTNLIDIQTAGSVGISSTSPGSLFSIQGIANFKIGTSTLYTNLVFPAFNATSTTASSTVAGNFSAASTSLVNLAVSGGATSTFTQGINVTSGCFAQNGTCVTSGTFGGVTGNGSANSLTYWSNASTIAATSSPIVGYLTSTTSTASTFVGSVGIATASPATLLSIQGVANFALGTSTLYSTLVFPNFTATSTTATSSVAGLFSAGNSVLTNLAVSGAATSTFAQGINLTSGCLSLNGSCLPTGVTGNGSANTLTYWLNSSVIAATSGPTMAFLVATSSTASSFNGSLGVGTTSPYATFSVAAQGGTTNQAIFAVASSSFSGTWATTTVFSVLNDGHLAASSTAPLVSGCGSKPVIIGNDTKGTVTSGSGSTGCTVTFIHPYRTDPSCVVTIQTGSTINTFSYTHSVSSIIITDSGLGSSKFDYHCIE